MCYIETGNYQEINAKKTLELEKMFWDPMKIMQDLNYTNVQGTDFVDALAATKIGFDMRNTRSNDFDAKNSKTNVHHENKRVSGTSKGMNAIFPDLNRSGVKLEEFKKGVIMTVSVCPAPYLLAFMLVLNSADIYDVIEKKFNVAKSKNRSSVSIPLKNLLFEGRASIVANTPYFTKEMVCEILKQKSKRYFENINPNFIYDLNDIEWVKRQHMECDDIDDDEMLEMCEKKKLFLTEDFLSATCKAFRKFSGNDVDLNHPYWDGMGLW